ncbi:hypothetical protein JXA85_07265 [Candidatus Woesearchaeota archaeon]|nr:hypothetical protein [Candidatus Woesearchaeota archaeon]
MTTTYNRLTEEQWAKIVTTAIKADVKTNELKPLYVDSQVYSNDGIKGVYFKRTIPWEFSVGRFLHENGVHVPEMYAYVKTDSPFWNGLLVMQELHGGILKYPSGRMNKFDGIGDSELIEKLRVELRKVITLGIVPDDGDWWDNSLFVPEKREVYLIDFHHYYYIKNRDTDSKLKLLEYKLTQDDFIRIG